MPKFTVTILRHQSTEIEVDAATEEEALLAVSNYPERLTVGAEWETTLTDPIDVVAHATPNFACEHCGGEVHAPTAWCDR